MIPTRLDHTQSTGMSLDKDAFKAYQVSARSSLGPRYRRLLFDILMTCDFGNVLEIGCLRGYSSCAFLEAIKRGCHFDYTICDIAPRDCIRELLAAHGSPGRVRLLQMSSLEAIQPGYDFIFIDGDHSVKYVPQEIDRLIACRAETMLAHDTYIETPKYRGAHAYRHTFSAHSEFQYIDDCTWLPETEQQLCGLSFFTRNAVTFAKVRPLFLQASIPPSSSTRAVLEGLIHSKD